MQACVPYQRHEWLRGVLLLLLERLTNYQRIKRPRRRDIVAHAIAAAAAALRGAAATRRGSQADDAIAALPRRLDPVDNDGVPYCECDTYFNGADADYKAGTRGCMRWHKTLPFHSEPALPVAVTLPKAPGDGKGYLQACMKADKNIRTGAAEEFEKDWQGGCPDDMAFCTFKGRAYNPDLVRSPLRFT